MNGEKVVATAVAESREVDVLNGEKLNGNLGVNVRYSDEELEAFKKILLARKQKLLEARDVYKDLIGVKDDNNNTNDTFKSNDWLEDSKSDMDLKLNNTIMGKLQQRIKDNALALERIENKTYGICEETGKLISKECLRAYPEARFCMEVRTQIALMTNSKNSNKNGKRRN